MSVEVIKDPVVVGDRTHSHDLLVIGGGGLGITNQIVQIRRLLLQKISDGDTDGYACVTGCSSGAVIAVAMASAIPQGGETMTRAQLNTIDALEMNIMHLSRNKWLILKFLNFGALFCGCCSGKYGILSGATWEHAMADKLYPGGTLERVMKSKVGLCIVASEWITRRAVYYFKDTKQVTTSSMIGVIKPYWGGVTTTVHDGIGKQVAAYIDLRSAEINTMKMMTRASCSVSGIFQPVTACKRNESFDCIDEELLQPRVLLVDGAYTDTVPHVIPKKTETGGIDRVDFVITCGHCVSPDAPIELPDEYVRRTQLFVPGYAVSSFSGQALSTHTNCQKDVIFINAAYAKEFPNVQQIQLVWNEPWGRMEDPLLELFRLSRLS